MLIKTPKYLPSLLEALRPISVRAVKSIAFRSHRPLFHRLNWWPSTLGGSVSYFVFWAFPLLIGFVLHYFELDGLGTRRHGGDSPGNRVRSSGDWERKTTWVGLAFVTM